MQEFINWGGETPEQLAERRRFEEEMREFMINKMLMEAARAQGRSVSVSPVGGGGGGTVQGNNNTVLLAYVNSETDAWEYFTANPASTTFSEIRETQISSDSSINQVYPINETGYVLVFNNPDSSVTALCLGANGQELGRATTVPTSDASHSLRGTNIFVLSDFDDNKFWIFDGSTLRLDETILSEAVGLSLGTDSDSTTAHGKLIVRVIKIDEERGQYREWWAVDATSSFIFFTDYFTDAQVTYNIYASWHSHYLVKLEIDTETGGVEEIAIIDLGGQEIFSVSTVDSIQHNFYQYGMSDSILITVRFAESYHAHSFDPNVVIEGGPVQSFSLAISPQESGIFEVLDTNQYPGENRNNTPSDSFLLAVFRPDQGSILNLTEVSESSFISKFVGQPAQQSSPELSYINTSNAYISGEAIIIPVSTTGENYELLVATPDSTFENTVDGIAIPFGEGNISSLNINRVANGFLLQVSLFDQSSLIHFITNNGTLPDGGILTLEDFEYNESADWYDEAGPLLYYSDYGIHAWLPNSQEWVQVTLSREDVDRFSTRGRYSIDLRDGLNYLLTAAVPRLYWFSDYGTNNIDDGGDDMYDGANEIYASSNETNVVYTHTQIEDDNDVEVPTVDLYLMDGTDEPGAGHGLGLDSTYFTNMYPGLFVMSAMNVDTDLFEIDGNLGADGDGSVDSGQIQLTEPSYSLFYKRVWGASDPSINQLIIVKSTDSSQIIQDVDYSSEDDFHQLSQLDAAGVTQIHYLLFALANGGKPDLETLTNLANQFVSLVKDSEDAADSLTIINSSYQSLLDRLPSHSGSGNRVGYLISEQSVQEFDVLDTDLDTVRLGETGFLVLSNDLERYGFYNIDYYNLQGQRVTRVETNSDSTVDSEFSKDRAVVVLENTETGIKTMYVFNESGFASLEIPDHESSWFSLNDLAWWD